MSTTTTIILNIIFIGAIVAAITGLLFHAIHTSPATERIHRRARMRAGARSRATAYPRRTSARVPAAMRD
jgi:ABC-type uncharacterized transport system permease subunit